MGASVAEMRHPEERRRVARTPLHCKQQLVTLTLVLTLCLPSCCNAWNCSSSSRQALLDFKAGLVDPTGLFSSWTTALDCCLWQFIKCRESDGAILSLFVTASSASGQQPFRNTSYTRQTLGSSLVDLDQLQTLKLQWVLFNSPIPSRWGSFSNNLLSLTVNDADLRGDIPSNLANIDYLQVLDLSSNHLTGSIPATFCDQKHLTYLDVSFNDMAGDLVPSCLQNRNNLTLNFGSQGQSTSPGTNGGGRGRPKHVLSASVAIFTLGALVSVLVFM